MPVASDAKSNFGQTVKVGAPVEGEQLHGQPFASPPRGSRLSKNVAVVTAVICLLAIHAGLLAHAATQHSPTMMEPAFLVAGLSHWEFGRFELFRVNPPLVRMLAALPVMAVGYEMDWSGFYELPGARPVFSMGEKFIKANGERSLWLITLARWACIPISLIGGMFCFLWSRELWANSAAGLVSLCMWCFEPNILAHAELITTDCAATTFGLGAGYLFWRWLRKPTWPRVAAAGSLFGLAVLSKATWIILLALWPVLWLIWKFRYSPSSRSKETAIHPPFIQLSGILLLGVYVLNLGYGFDGTFIPLNKYQFVSSLLAGPHEPGNAGNRFAHSVLGGVPVPLPKQFVIGIDVQRTDLEQFSGPSYLRGEWKQGGWWYYYLYGSLVKIPHGVQLILLLSMGAAVSLSCKRESVAARSDLCVLMLPAAGLFALVSSHLQFNHHFRYVLPCFGFTFVLGGNVCLMNSRALRFVSLVALFATAFESIGNQPHALAYFNPASGGPSQGYRHMLHSNLDWEQDLLFAKQWMQYKDLASGDVRFYSYYPFLMTQLLREGIEKESLPKWNLVSSNIVFEESSRWIDRVDDKSTERIGYTLWAFTVQE